MSYTPIGWQTGDTITADKLNKMDPGWGTSATQLCSETVTTVAGEMGNQAEFVYSESIDAPSITVTFDGTDYECEKMIIDGLSVYGGFSSGGPDFTDYPFCVASLIGRNLVITEIAGTYTITIKYVSVGVSPDFDAAVKTCVSTIPMLCVSGTTTFSEMIEASYKGRILLFKPYGSEETETCFITGFDGANVSYIPAISDISATFDSDDIFTVNIAN